MSKVLFVGGTFDNDGGKPSSLVNKIIKELTMQDGLEVESYNGGNYNDLSTIINKAVNADYTFWWANVPNDLPKIRNVKEINYKTIVISSKRNDDDKYSFQEILQRLLHAKSNLAVVFKKENDIFTCTLMDPLGNVFYSGTDVIELVRVLVARMKFLKSITRSSTTSDEENRGALAWYFNMFKEEMIHDPENNYEIPEKKHFLQVVKDYAEVFAKVIFNVKEQAEVKRFLGNASFRCPKGFPSFREGKYVFVSRRNVDKTHITIEEFVPTYLKDDQVYYLGDSKPSVDSPVQLHLYEKLPNIKYMLHAHVYIEGAPYTKEVLPCGALEEAEEIFNLIDETYDGLDTKFMAINLKGHGCLIMSDTVEKIEALKDKIISRPKPEFISFK